MAPKPADQLSAAASNFAMTLQTYIEASGKSRNWLAREVGCDTSYLTRLCWAEREPPRRGIVDGIARALRLGSRDRARLFWAAGLVPWPETDFSPGIGSLLAIGEVLTDWRIPEVERAELAQTIERQAKWILNAKRGGN